MNRIDELLDAAVFDGGMEPPALSEAEIGRVCALAEKIRARQLRRRKIWLVAAAFAASSLKSFSIFALWAPIPNDSKLDLPYLVPSRNFHLFPMGHII